MRQIIVVNEALQLPRGKLAAQVAHAALGAFLETGREDQRKWIEAGMAKVVVACESEQALLALRDQAVEAGLPVFLVTDAGRTVVPSGTITCLGVGPAAPQRIGPLTRTLRLL